MNKHLSQSNQRLIGVLLLIVQNAYMFLQWFFSAFQPFNISTWINASVILVVSIGAGWFVVAVLLLLSSIQIVRD